MPPKRKAATAAVNDSVTAKKTKVDKALVAKKCKTDPTQIPTTTTTTTNKKTTKKGKTNDTGNVISKGDSNDDKIATTTLLIKGKVPVDPQCLSKVNVAHVHEDANGDVYNFMLNQTNLQFNNNKYYSGQVLKDDNINNYCVWFRWGRVGKTAQVSLEPCGTSEMVAIQKFKAKFRSKTGNSWEDRNNFEKRSGFYDMIEQDFGDSNEAEENPKNGAEDKKDDLTKSVEIVSKLPTPVLSLISLISNIKLMEQAMREMNYDARRAPLGKLTESQIKVGYAALTTISECLTDLDKLRNPQKVTTSGKSKRGVKRIPSNAGMESQLRSKLLEACNAFYTRIPHDFGMRVPPLIETPQALKAELDLMKALEDIEVAFSIIKNEKRDNTHPADRHYDGLQCELSPMPADDKMNQIIKDYVRLTHAPTHSSYELEVMQTFICNKNGERDVFKDYGQRYLLWHGSRLTNWMGILGKGLRIAPPEAPSTGYMFGKGVYFADCASKSANYAYTTKEQNVGILALCEVSLGEINELFHSDYNADKLPPGKHSVKGLGSNIPDSSTYHIMDDGVVVPCGKIIQSKHDDPQNRPSLIYNEFIVYNIQQIRLRYLVQLKFKYKY